MGSTRQKANSRLEKKKGRTRTKSVFLVLTTRTETEAPVVLAYSTVHAVAEALVEVDGDRVCTADVEIDEVAAVYVIGRRLEEVHERAGEGETPVFWGDRQSGNVAVEVVWGSFGLAYNWCCTHTVRTKQTNNVSHGESGGAVPAPALISLVEEKRKGKRTVSHQTSAGVLGGAAHIGPA